MIKIYFQYLFLHPKDQLFPLNLDQMVVLHKLLVEDSF
jgi:hypothetical protein